MQPGQIVVESDDARCAELEAAGWVVVSRSWAAQLTASGVDVDALSGAVQRGRRHGDVRELGDADLDSVLLLDAATLAHYPGGVATQHRPLTQSSARLSRTRRGFGVVAGGCRVLAVTYVDVDDRTAETEFTVAAADVRGLGLGTAVKAASILSLVREGVDVFRTAAPRRTASSSVPTSTWDTGSTRNGSPFHLPPGCDGTTSPTR